MPLTENITVIVTALLDAWHYWVGGTTGWQGVDIL